MDGGNVADGQLWSKLAIVLGHQAAQAGVLRGLHVLVDKDQVVKLRMSRRVGRVVLVVIDNDLERG